MKLSLSKVKQFEPAVSSTWDCTISGGSVDTSAMNAAGGIMPVVDVGYDKWKTSVSSITIGPGIHVPFPNFVMDRPTQVTLTVLENDEMVIDNTLTDWVTTALGDGRAPGNEDWAVLTIKTYNKNGKMINNESYYVFPNMNLAWAGDHQYQARSYNVTFEIKGTRSRS